MRIELVGKLPPFLCSATKRAEAEDYSALGSNHITIANSNRGTHSLLCNIKSSKDTNIVEQECCRNLDFLQMASQDQNLVREVPDKACLSTSDN